MCVHDGCRDVGPPFQNLPSLHLIGESCKQAAQCCYMLLAALGSFQQCEDLEDTTTLAHIFRAVRAAIMLNDAAVLEELLKVGGRSLGGKEGNDQPGDAAWAREVGAVLVGSHIADAMAHVLMRPC